MTSAPVEPPPVRSARPDIARAALRGCVALLPAVLLLMTGCRGTETPSGPLPVVTPAPLHAAMAGPTRATGPAGATGPADAPSPADAAVVADAAPVATGDTTGDGAPIASASCACPGNEAAAIEGSTTPRDVLTLTKVTFHDLPGWSDDHVAEAVASFLRSCDQLRTLGDDAPVGADGHGGKARSWRKACAAAARLRPEPEDDAAARAMFEAEFAPYLAEGSAGATGKLTGYYVAAVHASRTRHGKFQTPVLGRPDDLVRVDLSSFVPDAHGRRIWGRRDHGELIPYYTRAEIRRGALAGRGLELMYVDDPVDLLFAQIEGSARAELDDGTTVWLEFAGKNGRAYQGVGGVLRTTGLLKRGEGTMQGIRAWFRDHPSRFDEIADQDAAYVFFSVSRLAGAVGSQRTILTAQRSMAVDRAFIAMSTPIWVETRAPVPGKAGVTALWHHLLIAQDTGAGIQGAVRGDIYWGDDAQAAELGGRMGGPGRYWLLLPRGVAR